LFDRVVEAESGNDKTNYAIPGNDVLFARRQLSGRLVFLALAEPEGRYVPQTLQVSGVSDGRGHAGPSATVDLASHITAPGAIVTGRVLNADGSPVTDVVVAYVNTPPGSSICAVPLDGSSAIAGARVDATGGFEFRYVLQSGCPFFLATEDPVTHARREVSARVRGPGQRMVLDIVLLGRGSVAGVVRNRATGQTVAGATVVALSSTDAQSGGKAFTDAQGRYLIPRVTVGPVTVSARKGIGTGTNTGRIYSAGQTATVDVELDDGAVNISGRVDKLDQGVTTPAAGALAVMYVPQGAGRIAIG